jgi:peptide-methionine (S)-S-oxide reductase
VAVFQHVTGVTGAVSGYAGGEKSTAHYDRIGDGDTDHAESVEVTFDPRQVSYADRYRADPVLVGGTR